MQERKYKYYEYVLNECNKKMGGLCKRDWLLGKALLKCEEKMVLVDFHTNYSYGHRKHIHYTYKEFDNAIKPWKTKGDTLEQ